ncbi:MAG: response regulator transcription factor [Bacteroidales bacterium]
MYKMKILVVDDERDLCDIVQFNLKHAGYDIDVVNSAEAALEKEIEQYRLLILDVMMSGMSGYELAKKLKGNNKTAHIPIIFLTAKVEESDILNGFGIGAEDYITKPFSTKELTARVKAVLKRTKNDMPQNPELTFETLTINKQEHIVTVDSKEIKLTKTEFEILLYLAQNDGKIMSREDIMLKVWTDKVFVTDRTVDVNITRLRKKIAPYGKNIITKQGYGYGFRQQ